MVLIIHIVLAIKYYQGKVHKILIFPNQPNLIRFFLVVVVVEEKIGGINEKKICQTIYVM